MRERPILFSGPMVRAILDGTKTQTRRILRPDAAADATQLVAGSLDEGPRTLLRRCPYGVAGDRLWVRETWAGDDLCGYVYRADHPDADLARGDLDDGEQSIRQWRPSIFMRPDASRITLDVLAVHIERLGDITEGSIRAEGVTIDVAVEMAKGTKDGKRGAVPLGLRSAWAIGWDAINGKRAPWASNPWVWVVSFKRAGQP